MKVKLITMVFVTLCSIVPPEALSGTGRADISTNPFGFRNYYFDSKTGTYYLKARTYSPKHGVFTTRDTADIANRYCYCNGDPVNFSDPSGHSCIELVENPLILGLGLAACAAGIQFLIGRNEDGNTKAWITAGAFITGMGIGIGIVLLRYNKNKIEWMTSSSKEYSAILGHENHVKNSPGMVELLDFASGKPPYTGHFPTY